MTATHDLREEGISYDILGYPAAQAIYLDHGWRGVLPLPPGSKTPPPAGFTGREGAWPSAEQLHQWNQMYPSDANLCLRLHEDTIGIDVDAYGTKTGAQTLDEAEKRWGALPPTVLSSSRDDGVSGIRLFRVAAGAVLRDRIAFQELGIGDIEILQRHHRYLVCWPSVHPTTKARYVWRDAAGAVLREPPSPDEVPKLPESWLSALSVDRPGFEDSTSGQRRSAPTYDVTDAITSGRPSLKVAERLGVALYELGEGTSRHDTVRGHTLALLRYGSRGESGVDFALSTLHAAFVEATAPDRAGGQSEAGSEFARMVSNAARLLDNETQPRTARAEDEFWGQRAILNHILRFSRSRGAAPYAVLGAVLRRAIDKTEPSTQLPAIVGNTASLNLFTVPVGRSGQGKDIANGVGRDAVTFVTPEGDVHEDPPPTVGIGSGEGLARIFKGYGNDDSQTAHVNLEVNEVGTLNALAGRQGATLIGELLKAYMGQSLGFSNGQRSTSTFVQAHSYRLCLSVGAQPENAEFFLSREKDGLPQRFLFLPTVDPYAPAPTTAPVEPIAPAEVVVPTFPSIITGAPYLIDVPLSVQAAIREHRHQVLTGRTDVDPLDGHLMLTQLKVAFGLSLLESRRAITEEDWQIAGQLIDVSNRARADMSAVLAEANKRYNSAKAHLQADRQNIIEERLSEGRQQRAAQAIVRKLEREVRATKNELRKAVTTTIRSEFDAVLETLLTTGAVVRVEGGSRYALAAQ